MNLIQIKRYAKIRTWHGLILSTLLLVIFPMASQATEEPDFKIIERVNGIEIRDYAAYMVAEVVVDGSAEQAGNLAFPILAAYIFGKNKGARKLAMSAPVIQTAEPIKLAMNAPVTQTATPFGFLVQFVLPKDITMANAPEPIDSQVKLREIAATRVGVIRYSGFWSDANYNQHLATLQQSLKAANLAWQGTPVYSRYDPPFMPWFLRRNEIWLHLTRPATP